MTSVSAPTSRDHIEKAALVRSARFPGLRALAWSGDQLYPARGYQLLCARILDSSKVTWQRIAAFVPPLLRRLSASNRFSARLARDGFHALAVLPSGGLVVAVAGAIIALRPGAAEFRVTYKITRGRRPLHITAVSGGNVFWGEYFDNPCRLTGFPNHPTGIVPGEWKPRLRQLIYEENVDGVQVRRTWLWPLPNRKAHERMRNYASFCVSAGLRGLALPRPDVVIGTSPQLLVALAGWWRWRVFGRRLRL